MKVRNLKKASVKKARRNMFLVKVPQSLRDIFFNGPAEEQIGQLKIHQGKSKNVVFLLDNKIRPPCTPMEYELAVEEKIGASDSYIMSRRDDIPSLNQSIAVSNPGRGSCQVVELEGKILRNCDLRPIIDANYCKINIARFEAAQASFNKASQITQDEVNMERAKTSIVKAAPKKKKEVNIRQDKEWVKEKLFELFQEQQSYPFKDLQRKTGQPAAYLRDILKEICDHITTGRNRGTYELKEQLKR